MTELRPGWKPIDDPGERYYFSRYEVRRVKMPTSLFARRPRQATPVGFVVCDHETGVRMTKPLKLTPGRRAAATVLRELVGGPRKLRY